MTLISGERSEITQSVKFAGFTNSLEVLGVNPSQEAIARMYGKEVSEVKKPEYVGKSEEGNTNVRYTFYFKLTIDKITLDELGVKELEKAPIYNVSFWVEDTEHVSQSSSKKLFVNARGLSAWAESKEEAAEYDWYDASTARPAYKGEDKFYEALYAVFGFKRTDPNVTLNFGEKVVNSPQEVAQAINQLIRQRKSAGEKVEVATLLSVNDNGYSSMYKKLLPGGDKGYKNPPKKWLENATDSNNQYEYFKDYDGQTKLHVYDPMSAVQANEAEQEAPATDAVDGGW